MIQIQLYYRPAITVPIQPETSSAELICLFLASSEVMTYYPLLLNAQTHFLHSSSHRSHSIIPVIHAKYVISTEVSLPQPHNLVRCHLCFTCASLNISQLTKAINTTSVNFIDQSFSSLFSSNYLFFCDDNNYDEMYRHLW